MESDPEKNHPTGGVFFFFGIPRFTEVHSISHSLLSASKFEAIKKGGTLNERPLGLKGKGKNVEQALAEITFQGSPHSSQVPSKHGAVACL